MFYQCVLTNHFFNYCNIQDAVVRVRFDSLFFVLNFGVIFGFTGRKRIDYFKMYFPNVGGHETPLSADWSIKSEPVMSLVVHKFCSTE